jgi:KDO2-lipid IV(A) lauroyltransferase
MQATGFAYMEMAKAWWASDQELKKLIKIEGLSHLQKALNDNKGAILLTAHFTSLEIGARLISLVHPLSVTYREFKNPVFDRAMRKARSTNFNNAIHRNDIRGLIKALKANDVVWYAADQDNGYKHSIFAPFFGRPAATLNTTGRLVKMSGAAILFFTVFRNADGSYNLSISKVLENYPGEDTLKDATRTNLIIENAIRSEPSQYLWIHRRYKSAPEGEHKPYAGKPRRLKEREQLRKQQESEKNASGDQDT